MWILNGGEDEMNIIQRATYRLAQACDGSPVTSTIVVMLFYVCFSFVEANTEILIFGERFAHFLDPVFALVGIGYAAYAVYWCAVFNGANKE